MNFVKRSLEKGGTRGRVGASGGVEASLLPASDLAPASSSCSMELTRGLTQGLRRVVRDPGAIAKELQSKKHDAILPNGLVDPLGMEFLKL